MLSGNFHLRIIFGYVPMRTLSIFSFISCMSCELSLSVSRCHITFISLLMFMYCFNSPELIPMHVFNINLDLFIAKCYLVTWQKAHTHTISSSGVWTHKCYIIGSDSWIHVKFASNNCVIQHLYKEMYMDIECRELTVIQKPKNEHNKPNPQ